MTSALRRIEAGSGEVGPAVVLEAGRNQGAAAWQSVMTRLPTDRRVIAYDRAGLGGSPPDPDPRVVARQLRDLSAVITDLGAAPVVLAGHSWGGVLVQLLACHRPELVAGLVLVDPAQEQLATTMPGVVRSGLRLTQRLGRDELSAGDQAASAELLRDLRGSRQPFPDVPVVVLSAARGFPRRFRARWTQLHSELAASAPQGRHHIVGDSGHNIPAQRPDAIAEAIIDVSGHFGPHLGRGGLG